MQESKSYQRHFALCLADFYSVSLNSINSEICKCCDDPLGNKQRLHNKFSKELDYCVQVLCKIGQEAVRDKFKEMLKKRHEELNSKGPYSNSALKCGRTFF